MKRFRVSIAGLMALVLSCAIGVAAMRSPTLLWLRTLTTITLLALALSVFGIVFRDGLKRAFWVGFAILGGGYWVVSLSPWIGERISPTLITTAGLDELSIRFGSRAEAIEIEVRNRFVQEPGVRAITREQILLKDKLERAKQRVRNPKDPALIRITQSVNLLDAEYENLWIESYPKLRLEVASDTTFERVPGATEFVQIGHNLCTLFLATLGGFLGLYFYETRNKDRSVNEPQPTSRATRLESGMPAQETVEL